MQKVASKNRMMFLGGTAIVGVVAIFIFSAAFIVTAPQAHAYAIGSSPTGITPGAGASTSAGSTAGSSYDFGSSLQNLVSPFTSFISNLNLNNNTTINTGGETPGFPTVNVTGPAMNGIQNIVSGWLSEFNNWFYGISGVQLSGIFYVLLNAISWTLGLAQQVVNWLLGLFH